MENYVSARTRARTRARIKVWLRVQVIDVLYSRGKLFQWRLCPSLLSLSFLRISQDFPAQPFHFDVQKYGSREAWHLSCSNAPAMAVSLSVQYWPSSSIAQGSICILRKVILWSPSVITMTLVLVSINFDQLCPAWNSLLVMAFILLVLLILPD